MLTPAQAGWRSELPVPASPSMPRLVFGKVQSGAFRKTRYGLVETGKPVLWFQSVGVLCVLAAAIALGTVPAEAKRLSSWWIVDYAKIVGYQVFLGLAWCSAGAFLLRWFPTAGCARRERALYAVTLGVVAFALLLYVAGALELFSAKLSLLLPGVMILIGLRDLCNLLRSGRGERGARDSALHHTVRAFGYIAAFLVVLQSATPDSIHYDGTWSHLTIAEDYAREGKLVPFFGFTAKNLPHFASVLYTWAYLVPGLGHPALHWLCAQWIELQLFGFTLLGVSAVSAWLVGRTRVPGVWATFFLFPGFYVYDSNFGGGSDHVAAFFALPTLIASLRAASTLSVSYAVLAGLFSGALMHTKFQGFYLVFPLFVYMTICWARHGVARLVRKSRGKVAFLLPMGIWFIVPLAYGAAFLLSFGPHLILNAIYYKNPVYPLLPDVFRNGLHLENMPYDPVALTRDAYTSTLPQALELMFTFSVNPQYVFGEAIPVFGSLFTLLTPVGLLTFRQRRLFVAFLLSYGALFLWCYTYRIDRNLQLVLPWFATVTGCLLSILWRAGWGGRAAVAVAVGLQVGWGSGLMLVGGHDRVQSFLNLVRNTPDGPAKARWGGFRKTYRELGERLPPDATLLLHTAHVHLGINRRAIGDWAGWQHVIDYRRMKNARDVYEAYRSLGITHITWNKHDFPATKQEDALFHEFTRHYAMRINGPSMGLWAMPDKSPPECEAMRVALRGLHGYPDGLYPILALGVFEALPPSLVQYPEPTRTASSDQEWAEALKAADVLFWVKEVAGFQGEAEETVSSLFTKEHTYYSGSGGRRYSIYLRREEAMRPCPAANERN